MQKRRPTLCGKVFRDKGYIDRQLRGLPVDEPGKRNYVKKYKVSDGKKDSPGEIKRKARGY